jgi:hypothetical protein
MRFLPPSWYWLCVRLPHGCFFIFLTITFENNHSMYGKAGMGWYQHSCTETWFSPSRSEVDNNATNVIVRKGVHESCLQLRHLYSFAEEGVEDCLDEEILETRRDRLGIVGPCEWETWVSLPEEWNKIPEVIHVVGGHHHSTLDLFSWDGIRIVSNE